MFVELKRDTEECLGILQDFIYANAGTLIPMDELVEILVKISCPGEVVERLMEREYDR